MKCNQIVVSLGVLAVSAIPVFADNPHFEVSKSVAHAVSIPLRDMKPSKPELGPAREKFEPKRINKVDGLRPDQIDPLAPQPSAAIAPAAGTLATYEGVGTGLPTSVVNAAPPDTNGAIGGPLDSTGTHSTQYVQWVNEQYAVFSATTGAVLKGPLNGNTIFSALGGPCATNNDGDPVVQWDKVNKRWILTQFSVKTTPYMQCVAVSQTNDALGVYNLYAFSYGSQFNDYGKMGVWNGDYSMTYNMFTNGQTFAGGYLAVFDGAAMRRGDSTARQLTYNFGTTYGGLLPADSDDITAPLGGSYVAGFGTNVVQIWRTSVNWTTPSLTVTGPTNLAVTAFSTACGGGTCIPQSGTTQQLDSLADRLMNRLAYRSGTLLLVHSVKVGTSRKSPYTGVRWCKVTDTAGTLAVAAQGTVAPDTDYRWMGSGAIDKVGNVVIGYSVSSATTFPSIKYSVVAGPDASPGESAFFSGAGSQLRSLARWGDYASMSVDPANGCEMFFTTEYLGASGTFNWSTRWGKVRMPSCN